MVSLNAIEETFDSDSKCLFQIQRSFNRNTSSNLFDRIGKILEEPKYRKFILKNVKDNQEYYFKPVDIKINFIPQSMSNLSFMYKYYPNQSLIFCLYISALPKMSRTKLYVSRPRK